MYSHTLLHLCLSRILRRPTEFLSLTARNVNTMGYQTHDYVPLHAKRDCAEVVKVSKQLTKLKQSVIIQVGLMHGP